MKFDLCKSISWWCFFLRRIKQSCQIHSYDHWEKSLNILENKCIWYQISQPIHKFTNDMINIVANSLRILSFYWIQHVKLMRTLKKIALLTYWQSNFNAMKWAIESKHTNKQMKRKKLISKGNQEIWYSHHLHMISSSCLISSFLHIWSINLIHVIDTPNTCFWSYHSFVNDDDKR